MWQSQLFDLLNNHTYNQCEVDLFELMCSVIERSLFAQVDWARNSVFFRDLKVSTIRLVILLLEHNNELSTRKEQVIMASTCCRTKSVISFNFDPFNERAN